MSGALACLSLLSGGMAAEDVIPPVVEAMRLARQAAELAAAGDAVGYLRGMESAVALRPDFPRMLVNLAAAQVANAQPDAAVATLGKLADLGLHSPVEESRDFSALRGRPDFAAVTRRLAANLHPRGAGEIAFTLREFTGLPEGLAWREATGEFLIGDVHNRAIWRRQSDGALRRLTTEDGGLLGVFALAVDEPAGRLWAATAAVPAMRGFTEDLDGTSALVEIALATGKVVRSWPVPRAAGDRYSHVLGDLALAADGTVWLTDSGAPVLWRLAPGAPGLEAWLESPEFPSLQGVIARSPTTLLVADHANGLLRIDVATRRLQLLPPPSGATLIGLDGLIPLPDGRVVAVQNGTRPARVLRLELAPGDEAVIAVDVLESAHLAMAGPALGCMGPGGVVHVIGNAGWPRFNDGAAESPPRSVPVFRIQAGAPALKGPAGR